jgi:Fe-S cluster biogenesis protein NfuA
MDDQAARDLVARVETLLDEVESLPGADKTLEAVEALVRLYGEGLARVMALADGARATFAEDELVAHLLLLHDLHPVPVEERVRGAVAEAGGEADVLSVADGVAFLRPRAGGCASCGSSAGTKRQAIEAAIDRAAPEVERVEYLDLPAPMPLPQAPAGGARAAWA